MRLFKPVLNLVLIILVIATFISGWVASWLGLSEFAPHRYAACAMTIAVAAHLAVHWRSLLAQVRRTWLRASSAPVVVDGCRDKQVY